MFKRFPVKLFEMALSVKDHPSPAIRITNDGTGVWILDEDELLILCREFFQLRTISAFKRQLNLYGFRLVSRGENTNAYCNRELLVPGTTPAHLRTRTENTIPNARAYGEPELYQAITNRTPMQALTTVLFSQESNSSNDSAPNVHVLDEVDIISLFDLLV